MSPQGVPVDSPHQHVSACGDEACGMLVYTTSRYTAVTSLRREGVKVLVGVDGGLLAFYMIDTPPPRQWINNLERNRRGGEKEESP